MSLECCCSRRKQCPAKGQGFLTSVMSHLGSLKVSWAKILFCVCVFFLFACLFVFFLAFLIALKLKVHQLLPCYKFGLWLLLKILVIVWLEPGGGFGGLGMLGVNVATMCGSCLGC